VKREWNKVAHELVHLARQITYTAVWLSQASACILAQLNNDCNPSVKLIKLSLPHNRIIFSWFKLNNYKLLEIKPKIYCFSKLKTGRLWNQQHDQICLIILRWLPPLRPPLLKEHWRKGVCLRKSSTEGGLHGMPASSSETNDQICLVRSLLTGFAFFLSSL
jgi:hypothetical protein